MEGIHIRMQKHPITPPSSPLSTSGGVAEAYIHFAGVHPEFRKRGVGCVLYERFFEVIEKEGREVVRCVTSPVNKESVSFHLRMGFTMETGKRSIEGIPVAENYDGKGEDRVLFYKELNA